MVDTRKSPRSEAPPTPRGTAEAKLPRTIFSLSEEETFQLGRTFARHLKGGELILLEGELGLGKTVFARGVAAGLGIAPEDVSSPSFTLVQEYVGGRVPMFHVDLYRLETPEDLESIGFEEILAGGGLILVEWGERLPPFFRRDAMHIRFHDVGEGSRRIELLPGPKPSVRRGDA